MNMMMHMIDENLLWQRVVADIQNFARKKDVGMSRENILSLMLTLEVARLDMESLDVYLPSALATLLELSLEVSNSSKCAKMRLGAEVACSKTVCPHSLVGR